MGTPGGVGGVEGGAAEVVVGETASATAAAKMLSARIMGLPPQTPNERSIFPAVGQHRQRIEPGDGCQSGAASTSGVLVTRRWFDPSARMT
jgi:hypothetical protein